MAQYYHERQKLFKALDYIINSEVIAKGKDINFYSLCIEILNQHIGSERMIKERLNTFENAKRIVMLSDGTITAYISNEAPIIKKRAEEVEEIFKSYKDSDPADGEQ